MGRAVEVLERLEDGTSIILSPIVTLPAGTSARLSRRNAPDDCASHHLFSTTVRPVAARSSDLPVSIRHTRGRV